MTTLLSAFAPINPIWLFGPYNPGEISAGSQPDWYMGFLEGALRMFPNWETHLFGYTIPWNVLGPALIIPGLLFTPLALYPFIERWVTGDNAEHHVLDRPRNVPTRTGLGVMALSTWLILLAVGANDIIAVTFHLSINAITWTFRVADLRRSRRWPTSSPSASASGCSAATATWCCTAARPAASSGCRTAR